MYNINNYMKPESQDSLDIKEGIAGGWYTKEEIRNNMYGCAVLRLFILVGIAVGKFFNVNMPLALKMTDLKEFMFECDYEELSRKLDAVNAMHEAALLDIHKAGGAGALDRDPAMLKAYLDVRAQVEEVEKLIDDTFRKEVSLANVF